MTTESDESRVSRMNRNSEAMEGLVSANAESNRTMLALVQQVREETEARDRKIEVMEKGNRQMRLLVYLVCGATAILLGLAGVNAVNIAAAKDQQNSIAQINRTLLDCTNYTGECGRANAAKQEEVLDAVKQYNLVGFYCIRTNPAVSDPTGEKFLKCMTRLYPSGPTLNQR